jgi:hypothetical protein
MEPFRLNPQAVSFLAVIALLSGALVFLAPFALLIMSAVGVVLLLGAWVKAMARERKLAAPFSAGEGAVALSALILVAGSVTAAGMLVYRLGAESAVSLTGAMFPIASSPGGPRIGQSSRHHSDAATQKKFKDELAKAGIPFQTRMQEGREFVSWPPEHNAAVEVIDRRIDSEPGPLPAGRAMGFGSPETHKEFAEWLSRRGVKSETVQAYGKDYLVWDEGAGEPRALMEEFFKDKAKRCKPTAQGPGTEKC